MQIFTSMLKKLVCNSFFFLVMNFEVLIENGLLLEIKIFDADVF